MKRINIVIGQMVIIYGEGRGDEKETHKELLGYWQYSFLDLGGGGYKCSLKLLTVYVFPS